CSIVACGERTADPGFLVFEEPGEKFGGDVRVVGLLGVVDQRSSEAEGRAVLRVVRSAGELNEATPFESRAVRRPLVPQVIPFVVPIERMAPLLARGIPAGLTFANGNEIADFDTNGRESHERHVAAREVLRGESVHHERQIALEYFAFRSGKKLG